MRLLLILTAILQLPAATQQTQQATPTIHGSIQGIVKAPNAPDGIPDAQISLTGTGPAAGGAANQLNKTTDAGGHFSFTDLPEGRYTLRAQKEGFFPLTVNGVTPPPLVGAIATATVTKDAPNAQVTIPLVPGGIISGFIRDQQGKGAAGIAVTILRAGYQDGRRTLNPVQTGTGFNPLQAEHATNDRGEYRIFWVPPGEYFVRTDISLITMRIGTAAPSTVPLLTFYPGTPDASRAIPVTVQPGQEVAAIDFPIEYAPAFKVSGKVIVAVPGGMTLPNGQVIRTLATFNVVRQDADPGERLPLTTNSKPSLGNGAEGQSDFEFELQGISPGAYYVYPLFANQQVGGATPAGTFYATRIPIQVFDKDVTGLTGVIHPNPDVKFHVTMQGTPPNPPNGRQPQTAMRVQLRTQEALPTLVTTGLATAQQMQPDGSITFPNVFPSRYKILLPQTPFGYYVADIRQGSSSIYNDAILTVTGEDSPQVEITFKAGGSSVQGIVHDKQGKPATASVTLIPSPPRRQNSLLYKRVTANADTGQFTLNGIAPGEYRLFAFQTPTAGAEENEEFLAKYQNRGRPVSITTDGTQTGIDLDLLSSPQ
jgi:hypothetical protein